jgi:hypothetical protein
MDNQVISDGEVSFIEELLTIRDGETKPIVENQLFKMINKYV